MVAALYTGGRYGELCKVRVEDFNSKALLIKWGNSKGVAKPRHAFLTDEAIAWFTELVKGRGPSELRFQRKDAVRTTREDLNDFDGWASYDQIHAMAKACARKSAARTAAHAVRAPLFLPARHCRSVLRFLAPTRKREATLGCSPFYFLVGTSGIEPPTPTVSR